jgi:hypothetical protein
MRFLKIMMDSSLVDDYAGFPPVSEISDTSYAASFVAHARQAIAQARAAFIASLQQISLGQFAQ